MAQKTNDAHRTNNSAGYITPPVTRIIRPLPKRAQRAHEHCPEEPSHSGMPASQKEDVAGPSNPAHIPPFPISSPQRYHRHSNPHLQQPRESPKSPTSSPPNKRLKINLKLPYFLTGGKRPTPGTLLIERLHRRQVPTFSSPTTTSKATFSHSISAWNSPGTTSPHSGGTRSETPAEAQQSQRISSSHYPSGHIGQHSFRIIPPSHVVNVKIVSPGFHRIIR